ncbi:MAG: DUF4143 domain-containing protein, partial [Oligoflexales bacterium]|nr:DUF4143 domain-containing protein [Oligoflexales bacterium]
KTVLLKSVLSGYEQTVNIDLLLGKAFHRYSAYPGLFVEEMRGELAKSISKPLIVAIDEIQKLPLLLDEVHLLIEENKGRIVFLLTGSSARKLKRGGGNLLAGRAITCYLHPLSFVECEIDLARALTFGTLPGIYLETELEIPTLDSYVVTYLREEIQQESLVRGIDRFTRFLDYAAQVNGEPVNFSKLGQQCGVSGKTAAEYYSILTDTMLAKQLSGWAHSVKKQLLQAPKFYFFDCGVLNALNGELKSDLKPSSFRYRRLFENYIVQELHRINDYFELGLRFHYWRDKDGHEVDVIVSRNVKKPLAAIEIKSHTAPRPEDCPGFSWFSDDYPDVPKWCICQTERSYDISGIKFVPWQDGLLLCKTI